MHVGLAALRELEPKAWVSSFIKVNLHPHHRTSFSEWCITISQFLEGGQNYKPETLTDEYALLPSWWDGMAPEEKRSAADILQKHDQQWSVACVREMHTACSIPLCDMQNLRLCLDLAAADPTHLDRAVPEASSTQPEEVAAAKEKQRDVSEGLRNFQLHPKKPDGTQALSGMAKFDHLCKMARRSIDARSTLAPSAYLDVEYSSEQQRLLDPTPQDFAMHVIASHCHGEGAQRHMGKRKLDAVGNLRGQCGLANDPVRLKRLNNQLNLASSLGEISKLEAAEKATKASLINSDLLALAPAATEKLTVNAGDTSKLTIKEIKSIALAKFKGTVLAGNKAAHETALKRLIREQPSISSV